MIEAEINQEIQDATILVVDDNVANAELLTEILRHAGYAHVQTMTDARLVAPQCRTLKVDLILLDLRMPHLNGFQVMEQLKSVFKGEYVPILVLTAQLDPEARRRSLEIGAKDFLTKPFITWELLHRVRNMLETRRLYTRLQDQNRILEERVTERTRALSEALEMAHTAQRAKLDFLAVMSHELRTPLNAIIGFAEVLASQPAGPIGHPDYLEYIKLIEDGGKNLLSMVNSILDYTKGATGTVELDESEVELRDVLTFCITLLTPKALDKRITVALAPGTPVRLRVDERRLRDMMLSLLDNAIKFNNPGGRVDLDIAPNKAPNKNGDGDIVIRMTDNGPGIAPEALSHIFDPFTQGEGSLDRRYEGLGLGLPIVRRYAELHDGTVELHSVPDQGTTVTVTLPARRRAG